MSGDVRARLSREVIICDGAMGTMLHSAGVSLDLPLTELNLSNPELVASVHRDYIAAGAQIIQTNTFGAARPRLELYGLEAMTVEINLAGARLVRQAADTADRSWAAEGIGLEAIADGFRRIARIGDVLLVANGFFRKLEHSLKQAFVQLHDIKRLLTR